MSLLVQHERRQGERLMMRAGALGTQDASRVSERAFTGGGDKVSAKQDVKTAVSQKGLQGIAAILCLLMGTAPSYAAGQTPTPQDAAKTQSATASTPSDLPDEPQPVLTQPLYLRSTDRDFTQPRRHFPDLFAPYKATTVPRPRSTNVTKLEDLAREGKIYLSLSDAIQLAIEDNYDVAIQRYNLDIADTDILRTKAGALPNGVNTGVVSNTIGGSGSTLTAGGGPGGSSVGAGGAGSGTGGLVISTSGAGPVPEQLDPVITGNVTTDYLTQPETSTFQTGTNTLTQNSNTYNFGYTQGFLTGTQLAVTFDNSRSTSNAIQGAYSPQLSSNFKAQVTQHLLYGFGPGINGRFIIQAKNTRRIADSAFRQQILFTINQVENIYWGLVTAYEDVQAKERSLEQSQKFASDERKQLQIGTVAPLEVVNAQSSVSSDQQALIISQSKLEYQQLIIKQAIARNLSDPNLATAPVIPTDRVTLGETPEEKMSADDLVKEAIANRPEIEQAVIQLKNDEISLKGAKNGLLPVVDLYAYYGSTALGGSQNPKCVNFYTGTTCPTGTYPTVGYGSILQDLFNNSNPDKGIGVNVTIPIRNRTAQAEQARSVLEYRQAEMRLQQLYVQIRIQVLNAQFALTNDRAQVLANTALRDYNQQSLEAEQKKYRLGASTTALVLAQQRSLANAEDTALSAQATYAIDRSSLNQILANTLDRYGISLTDAVTGNMTKAPLIPGLEPAKQLPEPQVPGQQERLRELEQPQPPIQDLMHQDATPDATVPSTPPTTTPATPPQQ
ncbi:MAG TPA: TolC family protein [Acidisarcina sp.]